MIFKYIFNELLNHGAILIRRVNCVFLMNNICVAAHVGSVFFSIWRLQETPYLRFVIQIDAQFQ